MISFRLYKIGSRNSSAIAACIYEIRLKFCTSYDNLKSLCKYLNINKNKGRSLVKKYPHLKSINNESIEKYINILKDIELSEEALLQQPSLFSVKPITIKYRYTVLKECGIPVITSKEIGSFLKIICDTRIGHLKDAGIIPKHLKIELVLENYISNCDPVYYTTVINEDINELTLYTLRIKIIQKYLEMIFGITEEEFYTRLKRYPNIKYRPLQTINEILGLLQGELMMPDTKIKSNFYLLHAHPDNLKQIMYNIKDIAGIDIKEALRAYPRLVATNYVNIIEIQNILKEFGVGSDIQIRNSFQVLQLNPATVKSRLEEAKQIPEFNVYCKHTRFLDLIIYKNTAQKRIEKLSQKFKKCVTIDVLCSNSNKFERLENHCGDSYKNMEQHILYIYQSFNMQYKKADIRKMLKRHPFLINIPLEQVKHVFDQLTVDFTSKDIYENCFILLYPWTKIQEFINFLSDRNAFVLFNSIDKHIDLTNISKSQKLSLILYLLEKRYTFSGDGVWNEEKNIK